MAAVGTDTGGRAFPRLQWSAVITGVIVALAAHIVIGLVGAALGFAARQADSGALGAGAAIWGLITPFVATLLGAWVACRIATQLDAAGSNLHGVVVWCIGLIAGALFLTGLMATGAMTAGAAASGNAGALQRITSARVAGGAAMAALAGLLGAIAGVGIARSRAEGRGLGWKITLQRSGRPFDGGMREREVREREARMGDPYAAGRVATPDQAARPDLGTSTQPDLSSQEPYHH